jgi:hypothetical protein
VSQLFKCLAECCPAGSRSALCCSAECRYDDCHYTECRGAIEQWPAVSSTAVAHTAHHLKVKGLSPSAT